MRWSCCVGGRDRRGGGARGRGSERASGRGGGRGGRVVGSGQGRGGGGGGGETTNSNVAGAARPGEVFSMTDAEIDILGANKCRATLRSLVGGQCANKTKVDELSQAEAQTRGSGPQAEEAKSPGLTTVFLFGFFIFRLRCLP